MFDCNIVQSVVFAWFLLFLMMDKNVITAEDVQGSAITGIDVHVVLYDKRTLQLEIKWEDNLPNSTSYNVIVSATNRTLCPEMPCSMYGISKLGMDQVLLLPEKPMSIIDVMECSYMFNCSYKLIVETSNAMISKSKDLYIPNCVSGVCSCVHASSLPKVQSYVDIPKNDTINFKWSIKWIDSGGRESLTRQQADDKLESMKLYKLYLKVSEQTNPSLSWGGKLIPVVENVYSLGNMSYVNTHNKLQGEMKISTGYKLPTNAVLNLHSFIEDELGCSGPPNLVKIKVPFFSDSLAKLNGLDFEMWHAKWTVGATVSLSIGIFLLLFIVWQRRKRKQSLSEGKKDEHCMTPIAVDIDMEDNLNYVDKYVAEAQANGLADIFEVPHHAIQLGEEVGEGAFGRVYKAVAVNLRRMYGTKIVAVKQLKRNPTSDEISEFLSEIEMLKGVGTHNNIVCFLGCCTIRSPYLMIMEYVGRGDLLTYLRTVRQYASKIKPQDANYTICKTQNRTQAIPVNYIELKPTMQSVQSVDSNAETQREIKPSFSETTYTTIEENPAFEYILDHKELHNFALQITNGMRFLEEHEITHRDLAARNVLIDDRKTLKISDFGLSRHGIYTNKNTRKLPLRWLSIEAIRDNVYSSKSDVWAFGVVLWEIGTLGASPYPAISNHELIPFLLSGKRLEKPEICTQQVYDIMMQCWNDDPAKRPSFEELFKVLSPRTTYVDINNLSDDYIFPPIKNRREANT